MSWVIHHLTDGWGKISFLKSLSLFGIEEIVGLTWGAFLIFVVKSGLVWNPTLAPAAAAAGVLLTALALLSLLLLLFTNWWWSLTTVCPDASSASSSKNLVVFLGLFSEDLRGARLRTVGLSRWNWLPPPTTEPFSKPRTWYRTWLPCPSLATLMSTNSTKETTCYSLGLCNFEIIVFLNSHISGVPKKCLSTNSWPTLLKMFK